MKTKNYTISLSLIVFIACFTSQLLAQPKVTDLVEEKENGTINWTGQYIEAVGMSAIDNNRFKIPAQAQMMAQRGAVVVAQRNLLEIVKGVQVTSKTTVKDFITESDVIVTEISGVVKGAQMVGKPRVFETHVEVTLRMPIYAQDGLAPILAKNTVDTEGSGLSPDFEGEDMKSTADMIKSIGLKLVGEGKITPSMFPKFVDENGKLLVDMAKLYDPSKGTFPSLGKLTQGASKSGSSAGGVDALIDIAVDQLGNFVVNKIEKPKLKKFVKGLIDVTGAAAKILLPL